MVRRSMKGAPASRLLALPVGDRRHIRDPTGCAGSSSGGPGPLGFRSAARGIGSADLAACDPGGFQWTDGTPSLSGDHRRDARWRTEEHTSELQSHSFISYAV